ncbi:EAL domain-containing protein [Ferriphaselus sp. R-1]|uniref:EAL domain-containing protein n=1 Tax=Ferriphaselus sp. R-1 TaxID=1485544 RepID=UPI0005556D56|nr:EAL domain-containing protein [Ferriphaselus sp. R-1]
MTLFRQLFIAVSILFLLLMAVIEVTYIHNSRTYLQDQLASHSQDVATSLGLVLPVAMEAGDEVKVQTIVGAAFDRGFYRSIRVVSVQGETLLLRELPPTPPDVPEWFTHWISLDVPTAESLITKGWRQMGRVVVSSHPNFAYRQLWATTRAATAWLFGLYLLSLILLHYFLRTILSPLRSIEAVAESISERDFRTVSDTPRARELRSVVRAINSLSNKVRAFIDQEVQIADRFRREAYQDPLTGLANRRGFELQIDAILKAPADVQSGALFMIHLPHFEEFNTEQGYVNGDRFLVELAQALTAVRVGQPLMAARIGGVTLVVASLNLSKEQSTALGRALAETVEVVCRSSGVRHSFGCGGVYFGSERMELGRLMSEADSAMLQATERQSLVLLEHSLEPEDIIKGSQYWKQFISDALEQGRTAIYTQPVRSLAQAGVVLQHEVTGRLCGEGGEVVPAAEFIMMANRHQLVAAIDRKFMAKLFGLLPERPLLEGQVAINLSMRSISDSGLVDWLLSELGKQPALARRIVFEFAEFSVVQDLRAASEFVGKVRKLGAGFAVDNFGLHPSAFEYLQSLHPSYIKLSTSYVSRLESSPESQFFISSVVKIARPLEVMTIAHGVESAEQLELLRKLGVDGYQGYAIGAPSRLD